MIELLTIIIRGSMRKLLLTSLFLSSIVMAASSYRDSDAAQALRDLDCEFEDCKPEVKVVEKKVIVEKPKVIIKEVPVEKIVYKERVVNKPIQKKEVATGDIVFNKAFFDIYTETQAPILDYITYSKRGSFDVNYFADSVSKIKEQGIDAYIHGKILVPSSIDTEEVYMNVGEKYHYSYYGYWKKDISYNNATAQNADFFLAKVKTDNQGRRYVNYKISIHLDKPWKINPAEKNVAPNTFFFKMAPKVRGFKNKFIPAQIFIAQE